MISVTSFAYVAGILVVAGAYALWRQDEARQAGWSVTAMCGGAAVLAAAYARWWGVEDGHTFGVVAVLIGFMLRVSMVRGGRDQAPERGGSRGDEGDGGAALDADGSPDDAREVEYGP